MASALAEPRAPIGRNSSERRDDRSARDQLIGAAGRMYAQYHLANVLGGAIRSFGRPDTIRKHGLNAIALLAATSHATWQRFRLDSSSVRRESEAWLDAAVGSLATLTGATAITEETWARGMAWSSAQTTWSASGVSLLGGHRSRPARLALLFAPHFVPRANRRALAHLFPGLLFGVGGFAGIGLLLCTQLERTAEAIDRLIEQQLADQMELTRQQVASDIERSVVSTTAERLRAIRDLIPVDRSAAAKIASEEARRLRAWFVDESLTAAASGNESAGSQPLLELGAEERILRTLRRFEAAYRIVIALVMVTEVRRCAGGGRPSAAELTVAVTGIAHLLFGLSSLQRGARSDLRRLLVGDVAMNAINAYAQRFSTDPAGRPRWSMGYSLALAGGAGTLGARGENSNLATIAMGVTRCVCELASPNGDLRVRLTDGLDETLMMVNTAQMAQQTASLLLAQAQTISQSAARVSAARAALVMETVRRERQFFIHDSALQVLMWMSKPDLTNSQLLSWIERELPKVEGAAVGEVHASPVDLQREIADLLDGFAVLGIRPEVEIDPAAGAARWAPPSASCIVDVLNEALTNVFKHSDDHAPVVRLELAGSARLTVSNHRVRNGSSSDHVGLGTTAMRDRVRAAHGRLDLAPTPTSFTLTCTLPLVGSG